MAIIPHNVYHVVVDFGQEKNTTNTLQQQRGPNRITNFEVVESDCSSHEYSAIHCCDFSFAYCWKLFVY